MKMYISIIVILISTSIGKSYGQTNDSIYNSIATLNLDLYASKPVDSFLHAIPQSYNYQMLFGSLRREKRVIGLTVGYSNGLGIQIKPRNYTYMNPIDSNGVWNLTLFKKEIASYITIIYPGYPPLTGQYP